MIAESLVGGVAVFHLILAPYTKVEESFNMQACHDMLYHGPFLSEYDHHEYPGVVPRSFLGPAVVSALALPFVTVARIVNFNKLYSQYIVRLVLSLLVVFAWSRFYQQVKKGFGIGVGVWFAAITITQFHFVYYLSRTLPNTFALIFALLATSFWLEQNHQKFIMASGIGVAVFRIDLALMLGPMIVHDLYTKRISFKSLLYHVVMVGGSVLVVTVAVDSLFWGRIVWPEGEVFYFNTVLNQSHLWGTLPLLWYFYSALPRALGASCLFVPLGLVVDKRMQLLTAPALVMVVLFSFLPHKELRFIIYTVPLFNVAAASACQYIYVRCRRSARWSVLSVVAGGHLLLNCVLTALLASASSANYPGGVALSRLHQLVPASARVSVHIDNLAAQSGATRFLQQHAHWHYNKTENLKPGGPELRSFSHLLVEAKTKYAYNLKHYANTHQILEAVEAFSHLSFNYQQFPPVKVRMKPSLFILENQKIEDIVAYGRYDNTEDDADLAAATAKPDEDDINDTMLPLEDHEVSSPNHNEGDNSDNISDVKKPHKSSPKKSHEGSPKKSHEGSPKKSHKNSPKTTEKKGTETGEKTEDLPKNEVDIGETDEVSHEVLQNSSDDEKSSAKQTEEGNIDPSSQNGSGEEVMKDSNAQPADSPRDTNDIEKESNNSKNKKHKKKASKPVELQNKPVVKGKKGATNESLGDNVT